MVRVEPPFRQVHPYRSVVKATSYGVQTFRATKPEERALSLSGCFPRGYDASSRSFFARRLQLRTRRVMEQL